MRGERTLDLARLDAQPAQLELGIEPARHVLQIIEASAYSSQAGRVVEIT